MLAAARHVITALILIHCDGAFWTLNGTLLFLPFLKIFILYCLAAWTPLMCYLSTCEASQFPTCVTLDYIFASFFLNDTITYRLRAPSQIRVTIDLGIPSEPSILLVSGLTNTITHVFICEFLGTAGAVHASYVQYFALSDSVIQIVLIAQLTITMPAFQTVKLSLRN